MNQHNPLTGFRVQAVYQHKWTDGEKTEVLRLREEGKTASESALMMGAQLGIPITRNSIISIWSRFGDSKPSLRVRKPKIVPPRASSNRIVKIKLTPRQQPVARQWVAPPKPAPAVPSPPPAIVFGRPLTILQCRDGLCRYGINDERPMLFCGAPTAGKSVYCAGHSALAYQPLRKATAGERRAHQL